jgi:hypothetical protein
MIGDDIHAVWTSVQAASICSSRTALAAFERRVLIGIGESRLTFERAISTNGENLTLETSQISESLLKERQNEATLP